MAGRRERVDIFTDGSCLNNGRDGAQAGIGVYFGDNHPMNVSEPISGRATNIEAEIQAATRGIELAKSQGYTNIRVNTDSEFVVKAKNEWMPQWKANNWKTSSNKLPQNYDSLRQLDNASSSVNVEFNYVPGHSNNRGNEAADRLARQGASKHHRNY